jgi:hypothetical protein
MDEGPHEIPPLPPREGQGQPLADPPRGFQSISATILALRRLAPISRRILGVLVGVLVVGALIVGIRALITQLTDASIDREGPQEDAAITLSDPQVYSREALINDRRREAEFLQRLLDASDKVTFLPHIQQTFQTVNLMSGSVGLGSSDPPQSPVPAKDLVKESDAKKNEVKKDYADGYPQERFRELQAYRGEIRSALARAALDDLHDYNGQALFRLQFRATVLPGRIPNKFGVVELKITPPKLTAEDDQRVYLAWLGHATAGLTPVLKRGATEQLNSHSLQGDSRYELLGKQKEIVEIVSLESAMSATTTPKASGSVNPLSEVMPRDAVAKVRMALPPDSGRYVDEYLINRKTNEEFKGLLNRLLSGLGTSPQTCDLSESEKKLFSAGVKLNALVPYIEASLRPLIVTRADPRFAMESFEVLDLLNGAKNLSSYFSEMAKLTSENPKCNDLIKKINEELQKVLVPVKFSDILRRLVKKQPPYAYAITPGEINQRVSNALSATTNLQMALAAQQTKILDNFQGGLLADARETLEGLERFPLVVGFSSRAGAENKAVKSQSQVSPNNSDIPAATPNMTCQNTWTEEGCPTFGWIFGPKYRSQSKAQKLEQMVASYDLAVDVSFPGWWPLIPIEVRSAWVENWTGTSQVLKNTTADKRIINVRIPLLTPPDLESLTGALTTEHEGPWGRAKTRTLITNVFPSSVSACNKEVTFVIEGDNLWRDAEVYWEGVQGKEITVLPGMRGITARFNLDEYFKTHKIDSPKNRARRTILLVETRGERDVYPIVFYGHRNIGNEGSKALAGGKELCEGPIIPADNDYYNELPPKIYAIAPAIWHACKEEKDITFLITGTNLENKVGPSGLSQAQIKEIKDYQEKGQYEKIDALLKKPLPTEVLLNGMSPNLSKSAPHAIYGENFGSYLSTLKVTFENPLGQGWKAFKGEIRLPLSVATGGGVDSHDVILRSCDTSIRASQ